MHASQVEYPGCPTRRRKRCEAVSEDGNMISAQGCPLLKSRPSQTLINNIQPSRRLHTSPTSACGSLRQELLARAQPQQPLTQWQLSLAKRPMAGTSEKAGQSFVKKRLLSHANEGSIQGSGLGCGLAEADCFLQPCSKV